MLVCVGLASCNKKTTQQVPEAVVEQVEPLRRLLESRSKLADLRNKLAGNEKLEDLLSDVLNNTEQLKELGAGDNQE